MYVIGFGASDSSVNCTDDTSGCGGQSTTPTNQGVGTMPLPKIAELNPSLPQVYVITDNFGGEYPAILGVYSSSEEARAICDEYNRGAKLQNEYNDLSYRYIKKLNEPKKPPRPTLSKTLPVEKDKSLLSKEKQAWEDAYKQVLAGYESDKDKLYKKAERVLIKKYKLTPEEKKKFLDGGYECTYGYLNFHKVNFIGKL